MSGAASDPHSHPRSPPHLASRRSPHMQMTFGWLALRFVLAAAVLAAAGPILL